MSKDATRRHIRRKGHDVVILTAVEGGEDEYGDATITTVPATVSALRRMPEFGRQERDASGAVPTSDASFFIEDSATISAGDGTQPSRIVDRGSTFTVVRVDDQDDGALVVDTEKRVA